jgi:hypothetical protein
MYMIAWLFPLYYYSWHPSLYKMPTFGTRTTITNYAQNAGNAIWDLPDKKFRRGHTPGPPSTLGPDGPQCPVILLFSSPHWLSLWIRTCIHTSIHTHSDKEMFICWCLPIYFLQCLFLTFDLRTYFKCMLDKLSHALSPCQLVTTDELQIRETTIR